MERGVRFIELTTSGGNGDRWDQHGNLKDGHAKNALSVDQPIAANMLHRLGGDHTRLTFRFSGLDMRLTSVHG